MGNEAIRIKAISREINRDRNFERARARGPIGESCSKSV